MRILRLRAYCEPETTAASHMTKDRDAAYARRGIVSVNYAPTPSRGIDREVRNEYKKKRHEVSSDGYTLIHRFPMFPERKNPLQRALRYLCCGVCEYFLGIREKDIDVVHTGSTPPTQGVLGATVAKRLGKKYGRHVPFVYNLQDIFPDSMANAGMTRRGSLLWKIGRRIEDYTYQNADRIIVISEGFKRNIMAKGVPEEKIVIVPNWVNTDNVFSVKREDNPLFDRFGLDRSGFYICYSGNIGHSQNLELVLETAKALRDTASDVVFVFIGEGAAKASFEKAVAEEKLSNVKVFPFQPYEDIAFVFSLGDAGLVISKPGIGGSSVPSKTWSVMAAERPVLASFDTDSELASLLNAADCGVCVEAGNRDALIAAIRALRDDPNRAEKGRNGRKYLSTELDKDTCIRRYIDTIESAGEH